MPRPLGAGQRLAEARAPDEADFQVVHGGEGKRERRKRKWGKRVTSLSQGQQDSIRAASIHGDILPAAG